MAIAKKMLVLNAKMIVILTQEQLNKLLRNESYYKTQPDDIDEIFMDKAPATYKNIKEIYNTFNNSDFYPIFGWTYQINAKYDYRDKVKEILYRSKEILFKHSENELYLVKIGVNYSICNYLNYDNVLYHVSTDGQTKPYKSKMKLNFIQKYGIENMIDLYMLDKIIKDNVITYERISDWRLSNKGGEYSGKQYY